MNRTRLLTSMVLAVLAANPMFAYFPQWVRSDLKTIGTVSATFSGDFNGDGRPDLVARTPSHTILLNIAQADRTFAAASVAHTATYLSDMLVADINGDGHLDLVAADTGMNSIDVRFSNGDGTFGAPVTNALTFAPTEIASGDFNGDNNEDLVVRSYSGAIYALFAGNGAGQFTEVWRTDADSTATSFLSGDIDHDGHSDFLTRVAEPTRYAIYFGRGDETFDAVVHVSTSAVVPARAVLADLDGDGDSEIITADLVPSAIHVAVNLGSRTFGAGDVYPVGSTVQTDAIDLVVAEVTDDSHVDVVVSLQNSRRLGTLRGNGNGTLRTTPDYSDVPRFSPFATMRPNRLTAADFTGDGRIDVALIGNPQALALFENLAGDVSVTLASVYPTISAGQTAKFKVPLAFAPGFIPPFNFPAPFATGLVTLKEGDTSITTGTFQNNVATIEVPSLALGTHTITAHFAGDDHYRAAATAAVTQKVVTQQSTVTLTRVGGNDEPHPFGTPLYIQGNVTSPLPGQLNGELWLYTNGTRSQYTQSGPNANWTIDHDSLGTYEFYATFEGTATQPPSTSEVLRVTVGKGRSTMRFLSSSGVNQVLTYGQLPEVRVEVRSDPWGSVWPAGNVRLYDGTTFIESKFTNGSAPVEFTPLLAPGVHYLQAKYEGSQLFEPSQTEHVRYTVFPSAGFSLDAYAGRSGDTDVIGAEGKYPGPPLGATYNIYRRIGSDPWHTHSVATFVPRVIESNPQPRTVYAYRMEIYDQSRDLIAISNSDVAVIFPYTDQPLTSSTRIKAVHVQEIVETINLLRATAGLSPVALAEAAAGQPIRLAHVTQLRQAINDARNALGVQSVTFSAVPAAGSAVLARHFQELRDAMQ
ncbi:MAG TPA: FG-GAP-like repeat-containing protein [Thermoanaerobaculia bacterium]|nr:FG-GAP-like repeat-containing protein [Thermoanaerobaculia bacterium]